MNVSSVILVVPDAYDDDGDTNTELRREEIMSAMASHRLGAYRDRFG